MSTESIGAWRPFVFAAAILFFATAPGVAAAPAAPPKELIEYVREAKRLGLKTELIQQNAVKAGWSAAVVEAALARALEKEPVSEVRADAVSPSSAPEVKGASVTEPAPQSAPETSVPRAEPPPRPLPDEYRIGAGDVLQVSVWKEPEASVGSVVVRPDGKIGLPLLKEIEVAGLAPMEAERLITDRLMKFIPSVDVAVVVKDINSKKIYVVGAVKREGPIPYTYRMTVMQALSEAGGLTDYAKRNKIYVLRSENGKEHRLPFDYEAVLRGERMELNIPLLANDTLVIPH